MAGFPKARGFDSTLLLLREGYEFILHRCRELGTDVFETRILFKDVLCFYGEDAARFFYEKDLFTRKGALPVNVMTLLQDKKSVMMKEGKAHLHRKQMFMSALSSESRRTLVTLFREEWIQKTAQWEMQDQVILHREAQEIICRAVCRWVGLRLSEDDVKKRTQEFSAMIHGSGKFGPENWRGHWYRNRSERWAKEYFKDIRSGRRQVATGCVLDVIANYEEVNGMSLDETAAAEELLNFLRPTVAVARYIVFSAMALEANQRWKSTLSHNDEQEMEFFVQEVRRFFPFIPFMGGRATRDCTWRGHHIKKNQWVLLDLYGTNHDSRIWEDPYEFKPERFAKWNQNAFNFIPSGGGDFLMNHRCPGEMITIDLMKEAIKLLLQTMTYKVPFQDISIDLADIPALPKSEFVIKDVKLNTPGAFSQPEASQASFPLSWRDQNPDQNHP